LQPLDIGVNSPFKGALRYESQKWMSQGLKEFASKWYRRRPNWETVLGIVSKAVLVMKETIILSFECCGIAAKNNELI
jgi:hypothetical protein